MVGRLDGVRPELNLDAFSSGQHPSRVLAGLAWGLVMRLWRVLIVTAALGCPAVDREPSRSRASETSATAANTAEGAVESMESMLHRFQKGVPKVDSLSGVSSSARALTRRYLEAVARSDTTALRDMHISRAEYAHLYFPSSKMMAPPYELPPDVAWMLHTSESNKGIASILRRFGGQRLGLEAVRCPGEPLREGPNIVWRDCAARYRAHGSSAREEPLFAAIIERDGRFKFFSYATSL